MLALPPLDPALERRLLLDAAAFEAMADRFVAQLPPAEPGEAFRSRALRYPWSRPHGAFVLHGGEAQELPAGASSEERGRWRADGRLPLVAIGSNGAPRTLAGKLGALRGCDARVLVEAGELDGLDIAPTAAPTVYGAFPSTPIVSPGTAVRASLLWVTPAQLEALTWSEVSYWIGALRGHPFHPLGGGAPVEEYLLYAARWGALADDGEPLALAALPARGRRARPVTQEDVLASVARRWRGPDTSADDLLDALATDLAATRRALIPLLRPLARPFAPPGWRALPDR